MGSVYQRYCLNLQGYSHLSDQQKATVDLAQRFKPAICGVVAAAALVTQSAPVAFVSVALGYWGAFLPGHPADLMYRAMIKPLGAPDLGEDPVPRRFACGMAGTLLLIGALGYLLGSPVLGTIFVGATVLALAALVFADFCVGSFFYWLLVRRRVFRGA